MKLPGNFEPNMGYSKEEKHATHTKLDTCFSTLG
jgi:hypothetical protein